MTDNRDVKSFNQDIRTKSALFILTLGVVIHLTLLSCPGEKDQLRSQTTQPATSPHTDRDYFILNAGDFPPYMISAPERGIMVDIARTAFERMETKVKFTNYPIVRGIRMAAEGAVDGQLGLSLEVAQYGGLLPSRHILSADVVVLTFNPRALPKRQWHLDLANLRGGVLEGTQAELELERYGIVHESSPVPAALIKKLRADRVDFVLGERRTLDYTLWDILPPTEAVNAKFSEKPAFSCSLRIGFTPARKNAGKFIREFDDTVTAMEDDGTLAQILSRYDAD